MDRRERIAADALEVCTATVARERRRFSVRRGWKWRFDAQEAWQAQEEEEEEKQEQEGARWSSRGALGGALSCSDPPEGRERAGP
jgi:hypothetical protein